MNKVYEKACKEVFVILDNCAKEDYEKIPKEVIEQIQFNMDKNYKYTLNNGLDFEKQPMLRETLAILSIIYRDYWATEKQRKTIVEKQKLERQKLENNKKMQYNPDKIFKNKAKKTNITEQNEVSLIEYKEKTFISKIWKRIKTFFKITDKK